MYFKLECPECGRNLKARDEHIGRRVGCPYCKALVVVARPESQETSPDEALQNLQTSLSRTKEPGPATPPAAPRASAPAEWIDGTNVSNMWSCLYGAMATVLFFLMMIPIAETYFGKLFLKNVSTDAAAWVPVALTFLLCWSVAILVLKWRKLARQKQSMLFDLLPSEVGDDISLDNVDRFLDSLIELPGKTRESFLVNRVRRGLEHFRVRKSAPEVVTILQSQSDIDANAVGASYTTVNVFIWAIPILGFIGTVIGISAAVGGFTSNLDAAQDVSALKDSLNVVTGGLATAFDTTLVALVMSMLVMFPSTSLQKSEEDMLNWVDEYCNENLLKRLNDGREGGAERRSGSDLSSDVQRVIQAELAAWNQTLTGIGSTLTSHVSSGLQEINEQERAVHEQKLAQLDEVSCMTGTLRESAQSLGEYCHDLQQGLGSLNEVLRDLDGRQIVIKRQRWRWFGRGNRA